MRELADSFLERNGTLFQILATVLVAVIGGLAGLFFRKRERLSKTLDYRVSNDIHEIFAVTRGTGLKIYNDDIEVERPRLSAISFKNTGTEVIEDSDYLEPLKVSLSGATVLSCEVAAHDNLVSSVYKDEESDGSVIVHPKTLNPGDWFAIQLVLDSKSTATFQFSTRIRAQTRSAGPILLPYETPFNKTFDKFMVLSPALATPLLAAAWVLSTLTNVTTPWWYTGSVWLTTGLMGMYTGAKVIAPWLIRRDIAAKRLDRKKQIR